MTLNYDILNDTTPNKAHAPCMSENAVAIRGWWWYSSVWIG